MKIFTIIADCLGGTFLSQQPAESASDVLLVWLEHFPTPLAAMLTQDSHDEPNGVFDLVDKEMLALEPVTGLQSVWGGYLSINEIDVFVHVVETASFGQFRE